MGSERPDGMATSAKTPSDGDGDGRGMLTEIGNGTDGGAGVDGDDGDDDCDGDHHVCDGDHRDGDHRDGPHDGGGGGRGIDSSNDDVIQSGLDCVRKWANGNQNDCDCPIVQWKLESK